jgi:hypothetical protein
MRLVDWTRCWGGLALPVLLIFISGCDLLFPQRDILDAARLYEENSKLFNRIRLHYPGPFTEARRVPAFNDADNRPDDIAFLNELQQSIPAEILQLYSFEREGTDGIEVVIGRYGISVSGSIVSLRYFENFIREEVVENGVEVFDSCDQAALVWLQQTARNGPYAVAYCRLSDHWYAYQHIT